MAEEAAIRDPVQVLRRAYEFVNRKEWDSWESLVAPDCVLETSRLGVGTIEGREAIRRFLEDWQRSYEEFETRLQNPLDLGNGVVVGTNVQSGRPIGSSGHVSLPETFVFVVEAGALVRWVVYTDIDEARAAAECLVQERG